MTLTNRYGCSYPSLQPRCFTWIRSNPAQAAMEKNPKAPVDMVDIYAIHIHQQWYDQHMHPLKLFPSCCRLCCALDAPLPASIVAFTGGKKPIVFGGKLECLEVMYIYVYIHTITNMIKYVYCITYIFTIYIYILYIFRYIIILFVPTLFQSSSI